MTDNEIIKALEWHLNSDVKDCEGCSYKPNKPYGMCVEVLLRDALDLINRQKAEIESLNERERILIYHVAVERENAIKEFAERLKQLSCFYDLDNYHSFEAIDVEDVDSLVKEMTEEVQ